MKKKICYVEMIVSFWKIMKNGSGKKLKRVDERKQFTDEFLKKQKH